MRILLVRHGQSLGNVDPETYVKIGDPKTPLTDTGWDQAENLGRFLNTHYSRTKTAVWPSIFVSSYLRTQQTLRGLLTGIGTSLFPGEPKLFEDPRLIEQNFGAVTNLAAHDDPQTVHVTQTLSAIAREAYKKAPYSITPFLGEAPKTVVASAKSFIDGTLARDIAEGKDDILIVCHGAVIKAFLMAWFHLPMDAWKELKTPGNCDVYCIEGAPKAWSVKKIYDGASGTETDINPIAHINRLTVSRLPVRPTKNGV